MTSAIVVSLCAAIASAGCGEDVPSRPTASVPTPSDVTPITVLSYNILSSDWVSEGIASWQHRRPLVFETIAESSSDVIGLQEVSDTQYVDLKRHFGTHYKSCWQPAWTNGAFSVGNAILYRTPRFVATDDCGWFALPNPDRRKLTRNLVWVRLIDTEDTDRNSFTFMSTHYAHDSQSSRIESSIEIATRIAHMTDPVILVGDFNASNDPVPPPAWWHTHNATARTDRALNILTQSRIHNVFWPFVTEANVSTHGLTSSEKFIARIDHIFATTGVVGKVPFFGGDYKRTFESTLQFSIGGTLIQLNETNESYPSDHFAIGTTVILPN